MTAVWYNLLLLLAAPAAAIWFTVRGLRRGRVRAGWSERLGALPSHLRAKCQGREVLWVHAVSVGETTAAKPLIAELRKRRPHAVILLSQVTETGRETASSAGADGLFYLPLDTPPVIGRLLDQLRPSLLVTIDTELWPNLFWVARKRGVKVAVANGRISDRSYRRIRRYHAGWLYRWVLGNADRLLMQSPLDAGRITELGAPSERVQVSGNLKSDEAYPAVTDLHLTAWRRDFGLADDEPVLLAGSTGPGEEAILLDAWQTLRSRWPALRLILVPRAVDRANEILKLIAEAGANGVRRSQLPARAAESLAAQAVIVVDTIGELASLYALADVVFVGRSLIPLGGSNVLQAAAQGKPVLSGPYVNNVRDSVALLTEPGVCRIVRSAADLAAQAGEWLASPDERARLEQVALEVIEGGRGATARTAAALIELLDA